MSLWNLLPSVANFAVTAINKPKDIKMNDKYLKSFLANLRGDKISGDVRQKALEAESKVIGKKTGRALRTIQAGSADPAQKQQAIVDLYTKESEAIGGASERASRLQESRDVQISSQQRNIEEYIAKTKTEIDMQNELREDEYKRGLVGAGVGALTTGVSEYGKGLEAQKALELKQQQDIGFLKSLDIAPEDMTVEGITHMVEQGTITADMAKTLITRKPEVEKLPSKPTFTTKNISSTEKQRMQWNPETNQYDIPFGEPELITKPTKPSTNSLESWQSYAKEIGVPESVINKAKSYRTIKDLTDKFDTLQWKKENLADIETAIEEGGKLEEGLEKLSAEFLVGRTKLPYSSLEGERVNISREIEEIEKSLEIKKTEKDPFAEYLRE